MAKQKPGAEPEETKTEAVASEPKGSFKAVMNVTCKDSEGNSVSMKTGDVVPSNLPKEEVEAMLRDGQIEKA